MEFRACGAIEPPISQSVQEKNALFKHRGGITPQELRTGFNEEFVENDPNVTQPSYHSNELGILVNGTAGIIHTTSSSVLKETILKSPGLSPVVCRPDKIQNKIGSCKEGQIKFKIEESNSFTFDTLISEFIETLQRRYFSWIDENDSLCDFWKMIGSNASVFQNSDILQRIFVDLQRVDGHVADAILSLDTEQLKKVEFKMLPRSVAFYLPIKTVQEIPIKKMISLVTFYGGIDFLERFLTALLSDSLSVDSLTYLLEKMSGNYPMCQFMTSHFLPLLEDWLAQVPENVIEQLPKCIHVYLPARILTAFNSAALQKMFSRVGVLLPNWNFKSFSLRRKWFKVIQAASSKPMVLDFRNKSLVLGMTTKELQHQLPSQILPESLQVLKSLLMTQMSLPAGHILLRTLLSSDENESRHKAARGLSNISGIGSYFTVELIKDLPYRRFMDVFDCLSLDPSTPEQVSLPVAWVILSRFFRYSPRPWPLTVPVVVQLQYLSFASSLTELRGAALEERLGLVHLPHIRLEGHTMASRQLLVNAFIKLLDTNSSFQEGDLHHIPLYSLPSLPFSTIQQLPAHVLSRNLHLFSCVARKMPVHHRVWLLDQTKDDLWLNMGELLTSDGREHLIPLLPLAFLRTIVPAYLTSRKYNNTIMTQAQLLPPNILRLWLTYNRRIYAHGSFSYSDMAWMHTSILGLACADVEGINLEDFLGVLHLYQHHIRLRESQTRKVWVIPVSLRCCVKKAFVQYMRTVLGHPLPPGMLLANLTSAQAHLLGGQVLVEFRTQELSLVPHPTCRLVFQLIGSVFNRNLLLNFSRCSLMAHHAVNCMKVSSFTLEDLYTLGQLAFCLDTVLFDSIKSNILHKFLIEADAPYQACPDQKIQTVIKSKLKEAFGSLDNWEEDDIYAVSGLLYLFKPQELFQIKLKALQGLANYLINLYQSISDNWLQSVEDSFPLVCHRVLQNDQMKRSIDTILLLARQAVIHSLHLNQEVSLSCDAIRSVGAAAITFTQLELNTMTELEFTNCFEFFGKIDWSADMVNYIWKRIKQHIVATGHQLTEEHIIQLNKLCVMIGSSEINKLNFTFPYHMDLVATLGRQRNWNEFQIKYLGQKWIQDNRHKLNLDAHEIAALNNILCGMPLEYLRTTPSVLRHSLPILSKLNLCSEDHLQIIALQVVVYDILGSPLLWDEDDLDALGIIAAYVPLNGSVSSSALIASFNKNVKNGANHQRSTFFQLLLTYNVVSTLILMRIDI